MCVRVTAMFRIARSAIDCRWSAVAYRRLVLESHTIWEDPTYKRTKAPALVPAAPRLQAALLART